MVFSAIKVGTWSTFWKKVTAVYPIFCAQTNGLFELWTFDIPSRSFTTLAQREATEATKHNTTSKEKLERTACCKKIKLSGLSNWCTGLDIMTTVDVICQGEKNVIYFMANRVQIKVRFCDWWISVEGSENIKHSREVGKLHPFTLIRKIAEVCSKRRGEAEGGKGIKREQSHC